MFLSQRLQNGASPYRRSKERTHDRSTAVAFIGDFANEQGSREKLVKSQRIFFWSSKQKSEVPRPASFVVVFWFEVGV